MRKLLATIAIGGAVAFVAPKTAEAQGPVVTGGLVNVTLVDVVSDNNIAVLNNVGIGVAANVAAQICGVQAVIPVGVLASQVARTGQATACEVTDQSGVVRQVQISRQRQ